MPGCLLSRCLHACCRACLLHRHSWLLVRSSLTAGLCACRTLRRGYPIVSAQQGADANGNQLITVDQVGGWVGGSWGWCG